LIATKVVTLAGESFHVFGPVKTSSKSKPASLSRQRELGEISHKIDQTREILEKSVQDADEIEDTLSKLRDEAGQIDRLHENQREIFENLVNAHRQHLLNNEQAKREMKWQVEQLSQIKLSVEESEEQIQFSVDEVADLEQRESEIEDQIDQNLTHLQDYPIDDIQERLTHWRTRFAVVGQALGESKSRHEERNESSAGAIQKSELIRSNINSLTVSHEKIKEEITDLKVAIIKIASQIETMNNLISPLEDNLETTEQDLTEMLLLESKQRLVSNQAEQSYTQSRITQVRKQEALDALRRQIEADFGLVAFEYREDVSGPTPLPLEGLVENLPVLKELSEETEDALTRQRSLLRRLGPVNPEAQVEYQEVAERYQFLTTQVQDLEEAADDVQRVIEELDEIMEREFCKTFEAVAEEFHQIFGRLFGGGSARLVLTDPDDLTDTGIDIEARLPGRREQGLSLLSGGERSLTAVALVFALLRVSPTPFCVLDEVDAMLDEANVGRFRELLRELSQTTQFILITHNRATVQTADVIYGVTMGRDSTSQILSLKVDELEKVV